MDYKASEIAEFLRLPSPTYPDMRVNTLLTDSRSLTYPETTLFIALRTRMGDGHRYIAQLYDKGVRNFLVDNEYADAAKHPEANFFVVKNTLRALQTIGKLHRRRFDIPVIAITGSRGKTTVKEWLYQILQNDFNIVRSPRSYNSQIGVPLSLWDIDQESNLAIIEAGVSKAGEMTRLVSVIHPTIGLVTNIGDEHADGFDSIESKISEKVTLLRGCDCVIYNADNLLISDAINQACLGAQQIAWSRVNPESPLFIEKVTPRDGLTKIDYSFLGVNSSFTIPFTSEADIENAIHTLAVSLYLRRHPQEIAQHMRLLTHVGTRLNVIEGVNGCLLVHDNYTADFHSLMPALDFLGRQATAQRSSTAIISDLMHESQSDDEIYRLTADLLRQRKVNRVIGIGKEIKAHSELFKGDARFFESVDQFMTQLSPSDFSDEIILLKGAPQFDFNRIELMLEAKHHETVLEVNLDSLIHNYNIFRSRLRPETGICAMVKASGYGAGVNELAKTLQAQGASYLAVAVLDEGVELRKAGVTMPIMVLNPKVTDYNALFTNRLEPEIYSFQILDEIIREAKKFGIVNYPVHLKLDTGMHRLGFLETDIPKVVETLSEQNAVMPKSIFSHLACADSPEMDDYTREQLEIFHRSAELLQSAFDHKIIRHILNSTGILRFPEHQCEMVRLGICLYGMPTMDDAVQRQLIPVSTLRTVVISIKEWPAGTTIGYSRKGVLHRPSRIATLPIGYADGLNRRLGNGHASFLINGRRCPTVGNICMDLCMVDVTDIPCAVGDSVEIFGTNISACEIADTLGTIPYEVLTSVSTRVKRVYFRE